MSSNAAKLKKRAAEFEQKKQFDKALQLYIQVLQESPGDDEADVALYNRVGDLLTRENRPTEAVTYYEKAVDLYAEGGFFNNAIALCNKILRQAPYRNIIYYKLGKISAQKGFVGDAKQNFLEYADRMQNEGKLDEAFRALKEFADLCPDQDDIRVMLADQLSKKGRPGEAIEQLQQLYDKFAAEGREEDMRQTAHRMKAIDAKAEPVASQKARVEKPSDLVFLDLGDDVPTYRPNMSPTPRYSPAIRKSGQTPRRASGSVSKVSQPSATTIPAAPAKKPETPSAMPSVTPPLLTPPSATPPVGQLRGIEDLPFIDVPDGPPQRALTPSDVALVESILTPPESPAVDMTPPDGLLREQEFQPDDTPAPAKVDGLESSAALEVDDLAGLPSILPDEPPPTATAQGLEGDIAFLIPETDDIEVPPPPRVSGGALKIVEGAERLMPDDVAEDLPPAQPTPPGTPALIMPSLTPMMVTPIAPPPVVQPPPAVSVPVDVVGDLRKHLEAHPDDWALHRELGELLLTEGERADGTRELEQAMIGYEGADDLLTARDIVEHLIRIDPDSVKHYQKRADYALRANEKAFLPEAYISLGEALFRAGEADKAKAVYQHVLDIAPGESRAEAALSAFRRPPTHETPVFVEPTVAAPVMPRAAMSTGPVGVGFITPADGTPPVVDVPSSPKPRTPKLTPMKGTGAQRVIRPDAPRSLPDPAPKKANKNDDAEFVNLGDWLRDDTPKSTRFVIDEEKPSGDEAADFADMLRRFKEGVAQNVDLEDSDSHYDLGVAYKEMGLLDEAISEFQKALRGTTQRVRTYEALGQAFLDKSQVQVAATLLTRSLNEPGVSDEQLVGVLYLLGYASETLHQTPAAVQYYQRVFAVDIHFRDVAERLAKLENTAK